MISIPMRLSANPTVPMSLNSNSPIPMNFSTAINQRVALSDEAKEALLNCFAHVAWIDEDGQDYYDALYDALYSTPPATLVSISAVYTQSGTVYTTTSLDDLKTDLVVTATYDDSSTAAVTTYTLSGTLEVGTSTVTVSYGGKTTTFTVTVSAIPTVSSISAVYTQSGTVYDTDSLDSLKSDLVVTATYSDSSTAVVPSADYTLSGTLTVGTSTITVSYEGKTTTFTVTVQGLLYPMTNGSHTFTGAKYTNRQIAVTDGVHVAFTNPNASTSNQEGSYVIFDLITANGNSANTTNINSPSSTLFTLHTGDSVVFEISNIVYNSINDSDSRKKYAMALRSGSTSKVTTGDLTQTDTSKTVTQTMAGDANITCVFLYAGSAITSLEFDVRLTVNGVRWI